MKTLIDLINYLKRQTFQTAKAEHSNIATDTHYGYPCTMRRTPYSHLTCHITVHHIHNSSPYY